MRYREVEVVDKLNVLKDLLIVLSISVENLADKGLITSVLSSFVIPEIDRINDILKIE